MLCMSNRSATNASSNQKQIPAQKTKSNGFECWQINVHRSKAASYNLCEVTKNIRSGIVLIQEPWTYGGAIRDGNFFKVIKKIKINVPEHVFMSLLI